MRFGRTWKITAAAAAVSVAGFFWGMIGRQATDASQRVIVQAASLEEATATLDADQQDRVAATPNITRVHADLDTTVAGTTSITDGTTGTTGDTTSTTGTTGDTGGNWRIDGLEENHLLNTLGLEDEPWDGTGVNVAVIDSGVGAFHETPFYGQWDFIDGSNPSFNQWETASDPYGHGTHVAGLIANNGWQSGGLYRGVAPNINRLYSLRVLNDRGAGYTSDVIRALDWVLANQRRAEVDVINLSLGHPILESADSAPLVQAVEAAVRAGIVVVVSAGNYGYNRDTGEVGYAGIASPGNAPSAITAGAIDTFLTDTRRDDVVARYSSRGPTWYDGYAKPDVVAPGSSLTSTTSYTSAILQENPQLEVEKEEVRGVPHLKLSGTSMAAAVTTGVVAQMIHAQRKTFGRGTSLTPNAVKAMLQYAALDLSDYDVLTQGAGALNGDGAVALAASIDSTTAVGQWWLTEGVSETSYR